MNITINGDRGYIYYSAPSKAQTQRAFCEIADKCRIKAKAEFKELPQLAAQLENELDAIELTGCAVAFEMLEAIATVSYAEGYPFTLYGNESASLVLCLLNATMAKPKENPHALTSSRIFVEELKHRGSFTPTVAIAVSIKEKVEKALNRYFGELLADDGKGKICVAFSSELEKVGRLEKATGVEFTDIKLFEPLLVRKVYGKVYLDFFGEGLFDHNAKGTFFNMLNTFAYSVCTLKTDKSFAVYLDFKDYYCVDDFFEELLAKGCTDSEAYELGIKGLRSLDKTPYLERLEELGVSPHFMHMFDEVIYAWSREQCMARLYQKLMLAYYDINYRREYNDIYYS